MNLHTITSDEAAALKPGALAVSGTEATLERFFEQRTPTTRRTVVL